MSDFVKDLKKKKKKVIYRITLVSLKYRVVVGGRSTSSH